jgi:hypothetical protein
MPTINYDGNESFLMSPHFLTTEGYMIKKENVTRDGVPAGTVMGKVTADGSIRPQTKAALTAAVSVNPVIPVDNAWVFKVGDSVTVGGGTAANIIDIDVNAGTITLDADQTASEGDYVLGTDGSETPIGLSLEYVPFYKTFERGLPKVDGNTVLVIHGKVDASKLPNYYPETDSALPNVLFVV